MSKTMKREASASVASRLLHDSQRLFGTGGVFTASPTTQNLVPFLHDHAAHDIHILRTDRENPLTGVQCRTCNVAWIGPRTAITENSKRWLKAKTS